MDKQLVKSSAAPDDLVSLVESSCNIVELPKVSSSCVREESDVSIAIVKQSACQFWKSFPCQTRTILGLHIHQIS